MIFLLSKRSFLIKIRTLYMAMLLISPACLALSAGENNKNTNLTHVILDYRISLVSLPLDYYLLEKVQHPYNLNSQEWSPQGVVSPERWQNGVDIYIPDSARENNALVVINDGSNNNGVRDVRDVSIAHNQTFQY